MVSDERNLCNIIVQTAEWMSGLVGTSLHYKNWGNSNRDEGWRCIMWCQSSPLTMLTALGNTSPRCISCCWLVKQYEYCCAPWSRKRVTCAQTREGSHLCCLVLVLCVSVHMPYPYAWWIPANLQNVVLCTLFVLGQKLWRLMPLYEDTRTHFLQRHLTKDI